MKDRVCSLLRIQPPVLLNRGLLLLSGATVPTDETDGYQPGCFFQDTTNGIVYINEGSVTSCEFNAITTGGLADTLQIGAFASLIAGSGIPISSTQTGAALIYSDDAGVNIATSCRGLLSRFLLTTDASGSSIRALIGQLKLTDLTDVETGVYTAVQGYVELAGTSIAKANAHLSCFDASFEIASGETLTVNQYGKVAGLYVETTGAGTITVDSGGLMAGVVITKATGAPDWPLGILISGKDVTEGLRVGSFVSTTATLGVSLTTAVTAANRFYSDDADTAIVNTGVNDTRGVLSRVLATADHSANELRLFALEGQLKSYDGIWGNEMVAGVYGYLEIVRNSATLTLTDYGFSAGVMSCVESSGVVTIDTNHVLSGFCAVSKIKSTLVPDGITAAFHAAIYDGTNWSSSGEDETAWEYGLYVGASAVGIGVGIGTCTTGIALAGVCSTEAITIATQAVSIMTAGLTNAGGASELNALNFAWTTTTTYGANADYIRGTNTFAVEAFLAIGSAGTAAVVNAAGSHVGILTNINITAAITGDTDVVGGGYHVVTLSAVPTQHAGIISPVTGYARNTVVCTGSTEFFGARAVIYTTTSGESVSQSALEVAIVDKTTTRATVGDIKGIMLSMEVADDESTTQIIGICLEETGTVAVKKGIHYRAGTFTVGIDFDDYCTTAIDIGNATTGITLTGTIATGITIASSVTLPVSITVSSSTSTAKPAIRVDWTTATTYGSGGDPVYGSMAVEGCIEVGQGDQPNSSTINAAGSHVAYLASMNLATDLAQYDLYGGLLAVCTIGTAQTITDSVIAGVTGYIRNVSATAIVIKSIQEAVRGVIYTRATDESVRQVALKGDIIDMGAHADSAEEIKGLQLDIQVAATNSGTIYGIEILTNPGAVAAPVDLDAAIHLSNDNFDAFVAFDTAEGTGFATAKPVKIGSMTNIGSQNNTADGILKFTIGGVAYYAMLWAAGSFTGE